MGFACDAPRQFKVKPSRSFDAQPSPWLLSLPERHSCEWFGGTRSQQSWSMWPHALVLCSLSIEEWNYVKFVGISIFGKSSEVQLFADDAGEVSVTSKALHMGAAASTKKGGPILIREDHAVTLEEDFATLSNTCKTNEWNLCFSGTFDLKLVGHPAVISYISVTSGLRAVGGTAGLTNGFFWPLLSY